MATSIALESNIRANLFALQTTTKAMSTTQERLATGKKVNSIIDSPTNFFAARNLNNRADQLNGRLDGMGQAIQTLNAANQGIDAIRNLLANAKALINDALANSNAETRRELGNQYNTVLEQASLIAKDSGYQGINLLANNQNISIEFGQTNGESALVVKGLDVQGQGGNGVSEVTAVRTESRASTSSRAAVSSLASQASVAAVASAGTTASSAAIASIASQSSVASFASIASQGTSAGQASIGNVPSAASQASVASRLGVASSGTIASSAMVASQASIASRASSASAGTTASASATYTQSYAFSMQVTPGDASTTVGLRKHSGAMNTAGDIGSHRVDFGAASYLDVLQDMTREIDAFDEALQTQASRISTNLNIVTVRENFTEDMINTLEGGADKLVLADMNEEGANLLALQTRQSLAIQSLALSSQQSQQVLRLLS